MSTIFVSIASFMDPLLETTMYDIQNNAKYPDRIFFGIVQQDIKEKCETLKKKYESNTNIRILSFLPVESKGCCWARAKALSLMQNETYYLQCDSHNLFVKHWDELCINLLSVCEKETQNDKVILSTYGTPANLKPFICTHQDAPYFMKSECFYEIPKVKFIPEQISPDCKAPIKSYTISGHFIFTKSSWTQHVPYDELMYFNGEEDSLAIRSFTHGYDIFYPHIQITYHYYMRMNATKHCDVYDNWEILDNQSNERFAKLLHNEIQSPYGLGNVRTLDDYTTQSCIDYINKRIIQSEKFIFGNITFIKTADNWTELESRKVYKELKSSDQFILIYDNKLDTYGKLNKLNRTFEISKNLHNWSIIGDANDREISLLYGFHNFVKEKHELLWTEKFKSESRWTFKELINDEKYVILFDESRNVTLRLHKNLLCYEGKWMCCSDFVPLYRAPCRPTLNLLPPMYTPTNSNQYVFGFSYLHKFNEETALWSEYCKNKDESFQFYQMEETDEYYIICDPVRKLYYKMDKNLEKLQILLVNKYWITLLKNGENIHPLNIENTSVSNDLQIQNSTMKEDELIMVENELETELNLEVETRFATKLFQNNFKSQVCIICIGNSKVQYFEQMKTNHLSYANFHRYSYIFFDKNEHYDIDILQQYSKDFQFILAISPKCIFTNKQPLKNFAKTAAAVTSFDQKYIHNHMIFFNTKYNNIVQIIKLFQTEIAFQAKPENVINVKLGILGCNYQNHNQSCFALIVHLMEDEQILEQYKKWNGNLFLK